VQQPVRGVATLCWTDDSRSCSCPSWRLAAVAVEARPTSSGTTSAAPRMERSQGTNSLTLQRKVTSYASPHSGYIDALFS